MRERVKLRFEAFLVRPFWYGPFWFAAFLDQYLIIYELNGNTVVFVLIAILLIFKNTMEDAINNFIGLESINSIIF